MKRIGAHVSAEGGVQNTPMNAREIGAEAFALFTKNQRQWNARPLLPENIDGFKKNCSKAGYATKYILPHGSYLINPGNPDPDGLKKSRIALLEEVRRCEQLGIKMLNIHPGAHLKKMNEEDCLKRIAETINLVLDQTKDVSIIVENTAGQGSAVGYKFEHLAGIIQNISDKRRIGTCIDTCHAFASGYDIATEAGYRQTWKIFEECVGFPFLKGVHLNDSKKELGSHVDRHEKIGFGQMGLNAFKMLVNDPNFDEIPMILETPDRTHWASEIKLLYGMIKDSAHTDS